MDLQDYRKQIDRIDSELLRLFRERMDVVREVALYKKEHGIPILDAAREQEKLASIDSPLERRLFAELFELSREYQGGLLENE